MFLIRLQELEVGSRGQGSAVRDQQSGGRGQGQEKSRMASYVS